MQLCAQLYANLGLDPVHIYEQVACDNHYVASHRCRQTLAASHEVCVDPECTCPSLRCKHRRMQTAVQNDAGIVHYHEAPAALLLHSKLGCLEDAQVPSHLVHLEHQLQGSCTITHCLFAMPQPKHTVDTTACPLPQAG